MRKWETVNNLLTLFIILFSIILVVFMIVYYINDSMAVQFLSGTNVTNVTWGLEEMDEYDHLEESQDWDKEGWTKLK